MEEIWKGLIYNGEDYSEWIEVSNLGKIKNPKTKKIRKQNLLHTGYYFVSFSMGSRNDKKTIRVHKAIAETFILNPENKPVVNHIDGDKLNNSIENLEWCTYKENSQHAKKLGLIKYAFGENIYASKLTESDVNFIRENYIYHDTEFSTVGLGKKFGVDPSSIWCILSNKTWKHI